MMPPVCFGPLKLGSHQMRSCDESRQGCGRNVVVVVAGLRGGGSHVINTTAQPHNNSPEVRCVALVSDWCDCRLQRDEDDGDQQVESVVTVPAALRGGGPTGNKHSVGFWCVAAVPCVLLTPAEVCRCNLSPGYYKNKIKSIK